MHLDVIARMTPVTLGIHIAKVKTLLQAQLDARQCPGDLSGDKGLPAQRTFMIEQNAVAGIDSVGFPIIDGDPVGIEFGNRIGRARVKRRRLRLRCFLNQTVEFRRRCLIETGLFLQSENANGLQYPQGPQCIRIGRIFRLFKGHRHMRLRRQIVDLIRLNLLYGAHKAGRIRQVTIVQNQPPIIDMRILIKMIDTVRIQ